MKTTHKIIPNQYLPGNISTNFRTLDGSDVAAWLTLQGYKVVKYYDTGYNGLAITECGLHVSTNGWVYKEQIA